jgi:hypothetical protein
MTRRRSRLDRRVAAALPTRASTVRHRGEGWIRASLIAAAASLVAPAAVADIYKCTSRSGHVTYSESPCPGESSVRLDLKESVESPPPRRPAGAPAPVATASRPPDVAAAAPTNARAGNGYELSYGERQRIAGLEQLQRVPSAYAEQREAAALEIASIRRGALARISVDDARLKDQYWSDLASIDEQRRRDAAAHLAGLLAAYP